MCFLSRRNYLRFVTAGARVLSKAFRTGAIERGPRRELVIVFRQYTDGRAGGRESLEVSWQCKVVSSRVRHDDDECFVVRGSPGTSPRSPDRRMSLDRRSSGVHLRRVTLARRREWAGGFPLTQARPTWCRLGDPKKHCGRGK
jgi:hypothetical protein